MAETSSVYDLATSLPRGSRPRRPLFQYLLLAPLALVLLLVVAAPLLYSLYISFHKYLLVEGGIGRMIGLANYAGALGEDVFWGAARNTAVLTVAVVGLELVVAFGLALLLNQRDLRFRNLYLGILLIPLLISPVAVGLTWRLLLHPELGIVNYVLGLVGIPKQAWLAETHLAMPSVIGVDVWHETSLMLIILLAGLAALPRDPHEAAIVDGASGWQILWHVTIPLMTPVILVTVMIRMIAALKTYDLIYMLTRGGPGTATETLSYFIWRLGFVFLDMGRAAAASFVLLAVIAALTYVLVRALDVEVT